MAATTVMVSKSCRKPPQEPPSFDIAPTALWENAKRLCERYQKGLDDILAHVSDDTVTFENLLLPLAYLTNEWDAQVGVLSFYKHVSPNRELQDASKEATEVLTGRPSMPGLSKFVKVILERLGVLGQEPQKLEAQWREIVSSGILDQESQKFLEAQWRDIVHSGEFTSEGSPGPNYDRICEIDRQLYDLEKEFETNLRKENGCLWLSETELAGVPPNWINRLERGTPDTSVPNLSGMVGRLTMGSSRSDDTKLRVPFGYSIQSMVLEYARDPDVRMKYYIGKENRCNVNATIFKNIINLRQEKADLLGYPNYMTLAMDPSMLQTTEAALMLLAKFQERVAQIKASEAAEKAKREDSSVNDKTLYLWDEAYYRRIWLESCYQVDHQKIAEYFPCQPTVSYILEIFAELFGIEFEETYGSVWHEDVQLFSVWDNTESGGTFVGYLYMDLFSRQDKFKDGKCACFKLVQSSESRNGERIYAASAVVYSISKSASTTTCLLQHHDIIGLFHELGHAMHHLLSRTRYSKFHGSNGTSDFREVPSILLENWCWDPIILKRLGHHFESGATIPDDLVCNLVNTKFFKVPFNTLQIALAKFDIAVHTPETLEDVKEMNVGKLYNKIFSEVMGLKGPEAIGMPIDWGHGYATRVQTATNYPGMYFSYISSYCIAEEIWESIFAKDPLDTVEGMRFRRLVLEKGGSQDPRELLENFLGERLV